jgi:hypothetical protein
VKSLRQYTKAVEAPVLAMRGMLSESKGSSDAFVRVENALKLALMADRRASY